MKISSRSAIAAALAAAAIAIPASSASAMTKSQCLEARIQTAQDLMNNAVYEASRGNWDMYANDVLWASWAYTAALKCT